MEEYFDDVILYSYLFSGKYDDCDDDVIKTCLSLTRRYVNDKLKVDGMITLSDVKKYLLESIMEIKGIEEVYRTCLNGISFYRLDNEEL